MSSLTFLEDLSENEFAVSGLHSVEWDSRSTTSMPPALFSLLHASSTTITHLWVVFIDDIDIGHTNNYIRLFACKFPSLISLKLGPGDASLLPNEAATTRKQRRIYTHFTKFLARHPTITELYLDTYMDWDGVEYQPEFASSASYLGFDAELLSVDILPNLTSLTAHSLQIKALAEARVEFLYRITDLTVSSDDGDDPLEDVLDMIDKLSLYVRYTERGFAVERLILHLGYGLPDDVNSVDTLVFEWLDIAAFVFPFLEKVVVPDLALGRHIFCFPRFTNLRQLVCLSRPDNFQEKHAKVMAFFCPLLETCRFEDPGVTYKIRGSLQSIYVIVEEDDQDTTDDEGSVISTEGDSDIEGDGRDS